MGLSVSITQVLDYMNIVKHHLNSHMLYRHTIQFAVKTVLRYDWVRPYETVTAPYWWPVLMS